MIGLAASSAGSARTLIEGKTFRLGKRIIIIIASGQIQSDQRATVVVVNCERKRSSQSEERAREGRFIGSLDGASKGDSCDEIKMASPRAVCMLEFARVSYPGRRGNKLVSHFRF